MEFSPSYNSIHNINMSSSDQTYKTLNQVLATTAGCLSVLGTIAIFVTFLAWRDLRTNSRKILVFISIGDLLTAIVNITGIWSEDDTYCKIEATVNIAAAVSSFFWTVYLSVYLYLSICIGIRTLTEKRVMAAFHVTAWGIPVLLAGFASGFGAVGRTQDTSDGWCWIANASRTNSWKKLLSWMLLAGKGWEMFSYIAITFFYIKVKIYLKQQVFPNSGTPFLTTKSLQAAQKADRKFTFIPIVFILLRIWGTVRFLRYASCLPECQDIGPDPTMYWLNILQGIGDSSQGFANFIIFCVFTEKINLKFRYWCSRVCCLCAFNSSQRPPTIGGFESTNAMTP